MSSTMFVKGRAREHRPSRIFEAFPPNRTRNEGASASLDRLLVYGKPKQRPIIANALVESSANLLGIILSFRIARRISRLNHSSD
jgi:hypothetical protein